MKSQITIDVICLFYKGRLGEYMEAYVLVNCEAGKSWKIAEAALKIENVKMAHAVTGQYDIVAYIEFLNMDVLTSVLDKFQAMEGVQRTHTAVSIPPRLK
jgi:DNA-binding Lrp family transcriptional regulator